MSKKDLTSLTDKAALKLLRSNGLYRREDIEWYSRFCRLGKFLDPYNTVGTTKEFVFFTKPNLHIFRTDEPDTLNPQLSSDLYFVEMKNRYPEILKSLQYIPSSSGVLGNPFVPLLTNSIRSTPDLSSLSSSEMDTATNMFGTTMTYRKDAWVGDEQNTFSLEFDDTKYLELYHYFKTYEMYERLKTLGLVSCPGGIDYSKMTPVYTNYHRYKKQYDTFGVYKFILDEDYETILYYAYICGAYWTSVPRDAFNDMSNNNGLSFTVDCKSFCVDDMHPRILANFNSIVSQYNSNYNTSKLKEAEFYDTTNHRINGDWVDIPYITKVSPNKNTSQWFSSEGMSYKYKLKWKTLKNK